MKDCRARCKLRRAEMETEGRERGQVWGRGSEHPHQLGSLEEHYKLSQQRFGAPTAQKYYPSFRFMLRASDSCLMLDYVRVINFRIIQDDLSGHYKVLQELIIEMRNPNVT